MTHPLPQQATLAVLILVVSGAVERASLAVRRLASASASERCGASACWRTRSAAEQDHLWLWMRAAVVVILVVLVVCLCALLLVRCCWLAPLWRSTALPSSS